jgi:hypothetical protein
VQGAGEIVFSEGGCNLGKLLLGCIVENIAFEAYFRLNPIFDEEFEQATAQVRKRRIDKTA